MDIKPKTDDRLEEWNRWANDTNSKLVSIVGKKITVTNDDKDLRVNWYTSEAHAEKCGEIVTIERWNGDGWDLFGLDADMTLEDLDRLNEELGGEI